MHKRYAQAAVAADPAEENWYGPLTPEEAFWQPPLQAYWAHRRLPLDRVGRCWATAVARRGSDVLVCVLDMASGRSRWLPAEHVLSAEKLKAWSEQSAFYR